MCQDLLNRISSAARTQTEIQELVTLCKLLPSKVYDELLEALIIANEGQGVSNLLTISYANKIMLDPQLFALSIKATDNQNIFFSAAVYQCEKTVNYLLDYGYVWFNNAPKATFVALAVAIDMIERYKLENEKKCTYRKFGTYDSYHK